MAYVLRDRAQGKRFRNPEAINSSEYGLPKSVLSEQKDPTTEYRRESRHFFIVGRVFKAVWEEPNRRSADDDRFAPWGQGRESRHSNAKKRMFVIVKARHTHCIALMIRTYHGEGAGGGDRAVHQHGIVYSGPEAPRPMWNEVPRSGNERPMQQQAIRVVMDNSHLELDTTSRINYGNPCTIEHSMKIKPIGKVHPYSIQNMLAQWRSVKSEDSENARAKISASASSDKGPGRASKQTQKGLTDLQESLQFPPAPFQPPLTYLEADMENELLDLSLKDLPDHSERGPVPWNDLQVMAMGRGFGKRTISEDHTISMPSVLLRGTERKDSCFLRESFEQIKEISSMLEQVMTMDARWTASEGFSASTGWQDELGQFRLFASAWNDSGPLLQLHAGDLNYDIFSDSILTDLAYVKEELVEVLAELRERPEMGHDLADLLAPKPAEETSNRVCQIHDAVESLSRTLRDLHEQRSIQDRDQVTSDMIERRLALIALLTGHIETTHVNLKLSDSRALARLAVSAGEEAAVCPVCEEPPEEFGLASETVTARDS